MKQQHIFWDYKNIDTYNELWIKIYLKRIITLWKIQKSDLIHIKRYYKDLQLNEYWINYFNFYFKKYDIN